MHRFFNFAVPGVPRAFKYQYQKASNPNLPGLIELVWQEPAQIFGQLRGFKLDYFELSSTGEQIVNSGATKFINLEYRYRLDDFGSSGYKSISTCIYMCKR